MHMTRSPTLQLKNPASIICELEGDDRCGQCENVRFRTCLMLSTSTNKKMSDRIRITIYECFSTIQYRIGKEKPISKSSAKIIEACFKILELVSAYIM
ncbi:unnamed protein product [Rotaria sp. Silwood1]|nr:unnamed protein product [Rotaria sp. Silwood1]